MQAGSLASTGSALDRGLHDSDIRKLWLQDGIELRASRPALEKSGARDLSFVSCSIILHCSPSPDECRLASVSR